MFEKFGEFNSAEELNRAAKAQKDEGDIEALKNLAKENGIDEEDALDYADGVIEELTTAKLAALGKITVEEKALKLDNVLLDWTGELRAEVSENEGLAIDVRKKGKALKGYIAALASDGYKHRSTVSKEIVKECSKEIQNVVGNHEFAIGIPTKKRRKELMYQYYGGTGNDRI